MVIQFFVKWFYKKQNHISYKFKGKLTGEVGYAHLHNKILPF